MNGKRTFLTLMKKYEIIQEVDEKKITKKEIAQAMRPAVVANYFRHTHFVLPVNEEAAIHMLPPAASAEDPDDPPPVDANSQPGPSMEPQHGPSKHLRQPPDFHSAMQRENVAEISPRLHIASLKERVVEKDSYYSNELERSQTNADRDILELRRKLDKLDLQYQEQIEKLVDKHEKEIDSLNEDAERKVQQLEQNWQLQMSSTRATLELVKEQMERDAQSRLEAAGEKHRNQLAMQWEQLLEEKEKALEVEVEKHRGQLDKMKQELEHAVKARNIRESELLETIEQLRAQLDGQSTTISDLEGNVDLLEGGMQVLNQQITTQSHEMTKVQQQAAIRISDGSAGPAMAAKGSHFPAALSVFLIPFFSERDATREAELHRRLGELATKHAGQQKQWQAQMCQMQEAAQKKINHLLQLLEESHQQCENCKSRQEDTQLIADLRKIVSEKDRELASLTEEKRFYQIELVNRETNNNRLFNSQPIVGVMDALQHRWCKGSSGGCAPSNKANSKQITLVTSSHLPSPVSDSVVQRSHSMDLQELVFSVPSDRCQSLDSSVSLPLPSANSTNNECSLQPDTVP
uniref:Uncharacterized protein n=1 Tax=Timema cristinae TaxID=61476 RepID=A0A7R9CBJ7_TIMCR|nr:unnamed protein product [Timema cristinae]